MENQSVVRYLAVVGLAALAACGPPPLTATYPTAQALARAVLDGLARADETGLRMLALSEEEFRRHVWPELPVARPERNMPFNYVWRDLAQKSDSFLSATLAEHGGRRYDLVRVRFEGARTDYPTFRVYRDATFVVRHADGSEHDLRVCGSFVEQQGQWKVFSYVTDD